MTTTGEDQSMDQTEKLSFMDPNDDDVKFTICMDTIQPGEFVCSW